MNREGDVSWFVDVRYSFDKVSGTFSVDQEAYIDTLIDNYGLTDCNPCQLPMWPDVDLPNIPLPSSPDPDNVIDVHHENHRSYRMWTRRIDALV